MTIQVNDDILLELIDEKHADQIFRLVDNNRSHLRRWLPWVDHMLTIEKFKDFITDSKTRYKNGIEWPFVIIINERVAGRIGINNIDGQNRIGSIGYWLGNNYLGKGITTEACKEIISHGFTSLNLNRIEIKCGAENYKSQAVPERLNFKKECIIRQGEFLYDKFIDLYLYSMLKDEWLIQHR